MSLSLAVVVFTGAATSKEARSALPDAPVVLYRGSGRIRGRVDRFRGSVATFLHHAAWAIEPAPGSVDCRSSR